jgi:hypothetical protein
MRRIAAIVAMWGFVASGAQAADCQLKQYASVDMTVSQDNLLVPVMFGDVRKTFAFRLGSGLNYVSLKTAEELDFSFRSLPSGIFVNRNGRKLTRRAIAPKFSFGEIAGTDLELIVVPPSDLPEDYVGTIGASFFRQADIELDMARNKLNVFSPDHCPGQVVYWTKTGWAQLPYEQQPGGFIRFVMQLDGKSVRAALDTNDLSTVRMNTMKELFGIDESSPELKFVKIHPETGRKLYRYPFKSLTGDGLTISNPDLLVIESRPEDCKTDRMRLTGPMLTPPHSTETLQYSTCFGSADVSVSLSVLSKLRLYISTKEKILYMTGANAR